MLEDLGVSAWYDAAIVAGSEWNDAIASAIEQARALVFFASPHSVASEHCRRELNFAQDRGTKIIVVHIEPTDLPAGLALALNNRQAIYAYQLSPETYLQALSAALNANTLTPAGNTSIDRPGPTTRRRSPAHWLGLLILPLAIGAALLIYRDQQKDETTRAEPDDPHPVASVEASSEPVFAMLPLQTFDPTPVQAQLAEGLQAEILRQLSKVHNATILSRSSVAQFSDGQSDLDQVAQALGATVLLTGTLRFADQEIRLAVDLVDVKSGHSLWTERYDRSIDNIFDVESDIATRVANALQLTLIPELRGRVIAAGTDNPQAHRAYLQALAGWKNYAPTPPLRRQLQDAVELDPDYADAHAYLAWIYRVEYDFGQFDGSELTDTQRFTKFRASERHARKALELNPSSGLAYQTLGAIAGRKRQWQQRLDLTRKAESLAPGDYRTQIGLGHYLLFAGQVDAGLKHLQKGIDLAPFDHANLKQVAYTLYYNDQMDRAEVLARRIREQEPGDMLLKMVQMRQAVAARDRERFAELSEPYLTNTLNSGVQLSIIDGLYKLFGTERADRHIQHLTAQRVAYINDPTFKLWSAIAKGDGDYAIPELRRDLQRDWSNWDSQIYVYKPTVLLSNISDHPEYSELVTMARTPRPDFGATH